MKLRGREAYYLAGRKLRLENGKHGEKESGAGGCQIFCARG
jgi:hypothetical protein